MVVSVMFMPSKHLIASKLSIGLMLILFMCRSLVAADTLPGLGRVPTEAELAKLPKHVFANGNGLPAGTGDSVRGKKIYTLLCADCHGNEGQGGSAMELVGDRALLATEFPDRGIAVYWPYAPTLFEYINRAMPPEKPYSLSADELYSVIARLLELNGLINPGQSVNAEVLSSLKMPNQDNFHSGHHEVDREH